MRRLYLAVLFFGLAGTAAAQIGYSKASGGGGTWGSITGTLADQTDLANSLAAKAGLSTGTATPSATACDAAGEVGALYLQSGDPATTNLQLFRCTQTGAASYAWHPASYHLGTAAPSTCTVGNLFVDSDATAGSNVYVCTSSDTWTVQGGGLGDPAGNGIVVRTAANTTTARAISVGSGLSGSMLDGTAGNPTLSADRAVVVFKGSGAADPPAACGDTGDTFLLQDHYLETDTEEDYVCTAIDTWSCTNCATAATLAQVTAAGATTADLITLDNGATTAGRIAFAEDSDNGTNTATLIGPASTADVTITLPATTGTVALTSQVPADPQTTLDVQDDFTGGYIGSTFTTSNGSIGETGWRITTACVGTCTIEDDDTLSAGNPGLMTIKTGGADDDRFAIWRAPLINTTISAEDWSMELILVPGTKEGALLTSSGLWFGLSATVDPTSTSGAIWIRRDTDRGDTAWVFAVCDSATTGCQADGDATNQDVVVSTKTPVSATPNRLTIRRAASGVGGNPTIYMAVGDSGAMETEKTFCSSGCDEDVANLPDVTMYPMVAIATRDAAIRKSSVDYFRMSIPGLGRY